MALVHEPRYILRLSDLPKIVQSDKGVFPIYMTVRDVSRAFGVNPQTVRRWIREHDLPVMRAAGSLYIEVAALNDWLRANSVPREKGKRAPSE